MNVGLAIEIDASVDHLMPSLRGIFNALKEYFASRAYGSDLIEIAIGVILTGPRSERLHPVRPFKYTRFQKQKSRITGGIFEIEKAAEWDVRPDFEKFSRMSQTHAREYLCEILVASTECLDAHRSKFPDFEVGRFREDFKACLTAHCKSTHEPQGQSTGS